MSLRLVHHGLVRRLTAISIGSAVGVALLYLVAVRTAAGQRFDDLAFDGRAVEDPDVTRLTNDVLHSVTRTSLAVLTAVIVILALTRRRIRLAVAVGAAITASVVTTEVLKLHLLTRPQLDDVEGIMINSFPSGHATIGMSLALGFLIVTPHHRRWMATVVSLVIAIVFGIGVLATGWHRPSDTIAAFLVCTTMFSAAMAMLIAWRGVGSIEVDGVESWMTGRRLGVAAVGVVVVAAVALYETFTADSLETVDFAGDYVLVCIVILAMAAGVVLGAAALLRGVSLDPPIDAEQPTAP